MNIQEELITKFYTAFQTKDWKTMQSCYHDEVTFSDPVFQNLKGKEVKAMWHMLALNAKDFSLIFNSIKANEHKGAAHWEATYSFSRTGRKVVNKIDAYFEFKDGLITKHIDRFDFWKWTRMALGLPGFFLGWSGLIQNKVRGTALDGLRKFIDANGYK